MQYLAILRLKPEASEELQAQHRRAEVEQVWRMTVSGDLRSVHFFSSAAGRGAVLQLEAAGAAEAQAQVQLLPMVAAGLLEPEILSLSPFTGLAALFAAGV